MEILSFILGMIKALPIVDKWAERFVTLYINARIDSMRAENFEAIKNAIEKQDQRNIEKAMGNPNAGKASGDAGTSIVDSIPGVHES